MAAQGDFSVVGGLCTVNVTGNVVEGLLIDDRIDEVGEVANVTHLHGGHHIFDVLQCRFPQRLGNVCTGCGGAFLSLIFEGATQNGHGQLASGSGLVSKDEILATRFAHDLGIGVIDVDILANEFPEALERGCAARKVDTCQVR